MLGSLNLKLEDNIKMDVVVAGSEDGNENQAAHYNGEVLLSMSLISVYEHVLRRTNRLISLI
jgi:hypothetical protein